MPMIYLYYVQTANWAKEREREKRKMNFDSIAYSFMMKQERSVKCISPGKTPTMNEHEVFCSIEINCFLFSTLLFLFLRER